MDCHIEVLPGIKFLSTGDHILDDGTIKNVTSLMGMHSKSWIPVIPEPADKFKFFAAFFLEHKNSQFEYLKTVKSAMC